MFKIPRSFRIGWPTPTIRFIYLRMKKLHFLVSVPEVNSRYAAYPLSDFNNLLTSLKAFFWRTQFD